MGQRLTEIYVSMLGEGTPVWRPVPAIDLGADVFQLADAQTPTDERWQFNPGDRVRCDRRSLSGGSPVLVAVAPLYRRHRVNMADIDMDRLRDDVLSDAHDDRIGLYEIVWSLNTQYPHVPRDAKVAAARDVVRSRVESGALSVFRTVWASDTLEPVAPGELLVAIDDPSAWSDPTSEPYFCVLAVSREIADNTKSHMIARYIATPLVAALIAASASAQSSARQSGLSVDVSHTDSGTVQRFVDSLHAIVRRSDRRALARLLDYPILAWDGAQNRRIRSEAEFLQRYDAIVSPALRRSIAAVTVDSLFSNWQGVMFDNGRVWFHTVSPGVLKIATINAPIRPAKRP